MTHRPPDAPTAAGDAAFAPPGAVRCLKPAGPRSVWLVEREGGERRTVKTWPLGGEVRLKRLVGASQPQRHARAARLLERAGIRTPRLLHGPTAVRRGGMALLELELEFVEGETALHVLRSASPGTLAPAADAVARVLEALLRARLLNRDLKLSNLLIAPSDSGPVAWLLDPVGVRRVGDARRACARMLERLGVEAKEQGVPVPRAVRRAVVRAGIAAVPIRRRSR